MSVDATSGYRLASGILIKYLLLCLTLAFAPILAHAAVYKVVPPSHATNLVAGISAQNSPTVDDVKAFIVAQAVKYDVPTETAIWIVGHESQFDWRFGRFDPAEVGDDGNSIGTWQISVIYHPEVPVTCSASLECSTDWAMQQLKAGRANTWSTYRLCRKLYKDCPF
jgi:hypothetical protein